MKWCPWRTVVGRVGRAGKVPPETMDVYSLEGRTGLKGSAVKPSAAPARPFATRPPANAARFRFYLLLFRTLQALSQARCSSSARAVPLHMPFPCTCRSLCPGLPLLPSLLGQLQVFSQAWVRTTSSRKHSLVLSGQTQNVCYYTAVCSCCL